MPQLVLFDDAGGELFRGAVSQKNVDTVAQFLSGYIVELRTIASTVQAFRRSKSALEEFMGVRPTPAPARSKPRPRRRGRG